MQRFRQAATKKLQVPDAVCSKKLKSPNFLALRIFSTVQRFRRGEKNSMFQNPYVVNLSESQKILALVIFSKHRAEFPTSDF